MGVKQHPMTVFCRRYTCQENTDGICTCKGKIIDLNDEGECQTGVDVEAKAEGVIREHFEKLWESYPRKLGKKAAWRHYKASVRKPEDPLAIEGALKRFVEYHQRRATEPEFIPYASTWFHNWRDWIDFEEPTLGGKHEPERPYFFADHVDGGRTMYVLVKKDGTRKSGDPFEQETWFKAGVPHAKELDRA